MARSIYEQILGDKFAHLHINLRRAHEGQPQLTARGSAQVTWPSSRAGKMILALSPFPRPAENVSLVLQVNRLAGGDLANSHQNPNELETLVLHKLEIWRRSFDGRLFTTRQYIKKGLLYERIGPVTFRFQLRSYRGALIFRPAGLQIFGIAVPRRWAIEPSAVVVGTPNGFKARVRLRTKLFKGIAFYTAALKLTSDDRP